MGSGLGAALSKWLGAGDYQVSSNSLVSRASQNIPYMHKTDQSVVIRHREFIATVASSEAYNVRHQFILNPGMESTFPWLSGIAANFQEYKWKGLVFHYVPTSGSAVSSTNPALGSVMMQTSYRSQDTPPNSKIEILNEYWSNETIPCDTMCHPVECDPRENPFSIHYVRSGNIPDGDYLMYDLGVTYVAVQGMPATGNAVGDIWVSYEVELKKPIVSSNVVQSSVSFMAEYASSSAGNLFATKTSSRGTLTVGLAGNTINLSAGNSKYVIAVRVWNGTDLGPIGSTPFGAAPTLTNATLWEFDTINTSWTSNFSAVACRALFKVFGVQPVSTYDDIVITLPAPSISNAPSNANIIIFRYD